MNTQYFKQVIVSKNSNPPLSRQNPPTPPHLSYLSGWGSARLQSQVAFFVIFWKSNMKETVIVMVLFMWPLYALHSCEYQIRPSVQQFQKLPFRYYVTRGSPLQILLHALQESRYCPPHASSLAASTKPYCLPTQLCQNVL